MAWQVGVTRATGDTVTAGQWNAFMGASGDFDILFDGTKILSELVRESSIAVSNGPVEGARLVARAAATGGLTWVAPHLDRAWWIGRS